MSAPEGQQPTGNPRELIEDAQRAVSHEFSARQRARAEGVDVTRTLDFLKYRVRSGEVGGPNEGAQDYPRLARRK